MRLDSWPDLEWNHCTELKLATQMQPLQSTGGCPTVMWLALTSNYEHVSWDGWVTDCFEFPVGSMAESIVEASTTLGYGIYGYLGCTVVPTTVPPLVSVHEPVFGPLPAAQSRLQECLCSGLLRAQNGQAGSWTD